MFQHWKQHKISILFILLGILLYWVFGYQLIRADFTRLCILWIALFIVSHQLIRFNPTNWKLLAASGLLFRIVFILAIPNLSQDFYRFIWDGRMLLEGYNPYLSLPETWIANGNAPIAQANALYQGMGQLNGSHYTNYPPISQLCYWIAAIFASKSILGSAMIFRILLIMTDIGTFFFGKKLLKALNLPEKNIFWYFLNPFIIIELTGNLHFEAVMVFFIIWALYLLHKGYWYWAAIVLGLSVSVKLIPLLFLPLFFKKFLFGSNSDQDHISKRLAKLAGFYGIVISTVLLTFTPFISAEFVANFTKTISLWFQNFEFNASIYYIVRWVGYQTIGWNIIETAGKILPLITITILLGITFFRKNSTTPELIGAMVLGISCYYFLSTTVHPWYIAVPLSLCVFTRYRFPIVWSFAIALSYSAYTFPVFKEELWLVFIEYALVLGMFIWEISRREKTTLITSSSN